MHLCVNTKADFKNCYIYKYYLLWQPLSEVLLAMAGSKKNEENRGICGTFKAPC